jgi:hypothetical protein
MKYTIESIEEIKNNKNKHRYYRMNIKDDDTNSHKLEFRTNYQFFIDDGKLWGFGSFSHRRCYENGLRIETFNGDKIPAFEKNMRTYLKILDLVENINYLEEHEKKEMLSEYKNDSELESILSKLQVSQAKPALPLPLENLRPY